MDVARTHGLPIVENPPDLATAPRCCTQQTVTVEVGPDQLDPKHLQDDDWGLPRWGTSYRRCTVVEGPSAR